jgi:hypothetical protein
MQNKSTLSSLGLLLGTPCSYLFNLFRRPVINLCTSMFKIRKFLFLSKEHTCVFYVEHRVYLYFEWFSEQSLRSSLFWVVTLRVLVVVHRSFGTAYPSHTKEPKVTRKNNGFLRVHWLSHVYVMPPMLHSHLHLYISLIRRTNGRILGTFLKATFFWK